LLEKRSRLKARSSLIDFTRYTTYGWSDGRIHREICSAFDAVIRKEFDRLILLCPPQHGKSKIASERFPAYAIGHDPTMEVVSASASYALAEKFGGSVRNCVRSPQYQNLFPGVNLREDSSAKGEWATDKGGGYFAVGIGGDLYGHGGHLGVIDDPFGSWQDAQSENERRRVCEWYTGTFYNRIRPGGAIVVIQHRMHEEDLVGWLMENEKRGADRWKVIKIPADLDNPPWAERYDRPALERIKANTFPREWSSLYLQDPTPDDGNYFKRAGFKRYTQAPQALNVYMSGDFAVTDDGGDYTELAVWGVDQFDNVYALGWWHGQKTSDVWVDRLLDLVEQFKPLAFVGEGGQIRRSVEPWLAKRMSQRNVFVPAVWLPSSAEKTAMARTFQGLCELGRVYFPHTDWADRVIEQCIAFPGGRRDDAVDACSLFGRHIAHTWKAQTEPVPKQINWDEPMRIGDFKDKGWQRVNDRG
jgi:predicted phage terminase large subunit-like protein